MCSFFSNFLQTFILTQIAYTGAEITLQALFGATKKVIRMDLGFGDRLDPIEHPIDLTATSKEPLF